MNELKKQRIRKRILEYKRERFDKENIKQYFRHAEDVRYEQYPKHGGIENGN